SLSVSEKHNLEKFVIYQGYYSLIGRDYDQQLKTLIEDQQMGLMAWRPLGWGRLTGKIRKNRQHAPGRIQAGGAVGSPPAHEDYLETVIQTLEQIVDEIGKSIPQEAFNWLVQQQTFSNVIIGGINQPLFLENIRTLNWTLSDEHLARH